MMTLFAAGLRLVGLSLDEAAIVLGESGPPLRPDTIKKWSAGSRTTPSWVWPILAAYRARMEAVGAEAAGLAAIELLAEHVTSSTGEAVGLAGPNSVVTALAARALDLAAAASRQG